MYFDIWKVGAVPPASKAWAAAGKQVTLLTGHYNHFEMPETLGNPYGLLGRAVLEQMKLGVSG